MVMTLHPIAFIISGAAVMVSLLLLVILLWQDARNPTNLAFGALILSIALWVSGIGLGRISSLVASDRTLTDLGIRLVEIGFTGVCLCLYLYTILATGGASRATLQLIFVGLGVVVAYQVLISFVIVPNYAVRNDGALTYSLDRFGSLLYGSMILAAVFAAWQRRRKVKGSYLIGGIYLIALGTAIDLVSPELRNRTFGMNIAALGGMLLSYGMMRVQIIEPLAGRASQLQAVRDVGLAISSRLKLRDVLASVATQAAGILEANGAAIFLVGDNGILELAAVHNMPDAFLGTKLLPNEGLAGKVATSRQSIRLDNYRRDWKGAPDMPFAQESFGSVVASPLIVARETMGVLLVIEGLTGRRFDREDTRLLELLAPQAAVAIKNSRLFERQNALTGALEAAKDQLEADVRRLRELDHLKNQMIRMTSHDLKNPLMGAMAHAELLREDDELPEEAQQDMNTIWTQLERMNRIISGILNLERLQAGKAVYEECRIPQILHTAVDEFRSYADQCGVTLALKLHGTIHTVFGSRPHLTQAIGNIIENGIKYTHDGGKVTVSAESIDDSVVILVEDTGIGIPPDEQVRLFEQFFRAEQARDINGTGLGLSLVKSVIDAHKGRIWLESTPNVGTKMYMALPAHIKPDNKQDSKPKTGSLANKDVPYTANN
jgi:signal transduction histidine kinase